MAFFEKLIRCHKVMISLKGEKKKKEKEIRVKTYKRDKTKCVILYCKLLASQDNLLMH